MGSFYRSQHELIFVFKKGDIKHTCNFGYFNTGGGENRDRSNIWSYPNIGSFENKDDEGKSGQPKDHLKVHPTPKPLDMIIDAILDCSNKNENILDLFGRK